MPVASIQSDGHYFIYLISNEHILPTSIICEENYRVPSKKIVRNNLTCQFLI